MLKRKCAIVLAILMIITVLGGCNHKKNDLTQVTLNEVAHSIFYAPMYVAIEEGYFEDEGIDLELVTGFGADKTMTAVNFAQLTRRAGNFLVGREPDDDFAWSDVKGSYVLGGRAGGMPKMVFEYVLKKNGIDPKTDLTIDQSIDFGSTAAAFSGGQGDYTVEFEPSATALELDGAGYVIASLGVDSGYVPYTAYSALNSYIEDNPETIKAFTKAMQKGLDYVDTHTAAEIAKTISPQFPETDIDTLTTIVERYYEQDTWKTDLVFEEESFTLLQDILESSGELSARVPYDEIVNTSFANDAKK